MWHLFATICQVEMKCDEDVLFIYIEFECLGGQRKNKLLNIAFETVPVFIRLTMALSYPFKEDFLKTSLP